MHAKEEYNYEAPRGKLRVQSVLQCIGVSIVITQTTQHFLITVAMVDRILVNVTVAITVSYSIGGDEFCESGA